MVNGSKKEPRRNAPRVNIRSNQIAYLNFQSGNGGIVLDVCASGLGFQAVEPVKPNESLLFRLSVPGFPHIHLSGQVAWVDQSRRRGGLRVTVPEAQRRAFQLWQQYLEPQLETQQLAASARGPDRVSEERPEAKRFRISRNVLIGCVLVALCVALVDGSRFLSSTRHPGDLHPARRSSAVNRQRHTAPPQNATPAAQNASPLVLSSAPYPQTDETREPSHGDAQAFAPNVSVGSAASARARSEPQTIAKVPTGSENRAVGEQRRSVGPLPLVANGRIAHRMLRTGAHRLALAASVATSDGLGAVDASRAIAAEGIATMNSSSPAPQPTDASQALASAAQSPGALSGQAVEAAANIEPCQLVSSVHPAYPKEARKQRVEGDVRLRVVVGPDGSVRNVAPVGGPSLLIAAAVDATRQFHYKPALLNGKPIETIQTVDISFELQR
jgi:TonB family protein